MAADPVVVELAGLVAELRETAASLRATAGVLADAARRHGEGRGGSDREGDSRDVARSAMDEIERARKRGREGGRLP